MAETRKKAGREQLASMLQESFGRLQATLDALPDLMFVVDREGRIRDYHAPEPDILYVPPDQFLGRRMQDLLPEPAVSVLRSAIADAVAHGHHKGGIYSLRTPAGERWFELFIATQGEPATDEGRLVIVVRDITDRRQAEDALKKAHDELEQRVRERTAELESSRQALARRELQFRRMAESIDEVFWLIDARTLNVLYASPAVERILRRPAGQFGFDVSEWFNDIHPDDRDRVVEAFRHGMKTGVPATIIYRLVWPDGTIRWIENSGSLIRDEEGKPLQAAGVMRDITERRYLETQVLNVSEDERQRIGRELHDSLRQSLTAIGYMAEALSADLESKSRPEAKEMRRLQHLIEQTAEEARAIAGGLLLADMKQGGLTAALQDLASRTEDLFGVPCRCVIRGDVPSLDEHVAIQLYRIAQEAATNAAKHSKSEKIEIRLSRNREGLLLSVMDTGKGLPSKKREGGGMGMDIMRYRAGIIGAKLQIDSSRKNGTAVNCLLPVPSE